MKPTGKRLRAQPALGTAQVIAATVAATAATRGSSDAQMRQTSAFGAFAGSGVMAHDAVLRGVSGRALIRIWEDTRGTLPVDAVLKAIGVSAHTAHRIKTDPDKPLDARTTGGIYRLESVRAMAEEVLGSAA